MERYEAYKDSGVEWIGEIPEGWGTRRFKHALRITGGNGFPQEAQGHECGDYPFCKVSDINGDGWTIDKAANYVKAEWVEENRINVVPAKSILMAKIGAALAKNHRKVNLLDCCIDNNMQALVPNGQRVTLKYLYWIMSAVDMSWYDAGGTLPYVDNQRFLNDTFPYPNIDCQQAIADYLDAKTAEIDALVADCEREVELLREYRKAVISEAVTKGLDPDAPMKDSGIEWIGKIPEHWEAGKLLRHARLESGHTPSKQHPEWWLEEECTIPWVTTGDVHRFRDGIMTSIDDTVEHVSKIGLDNSSARLLPAGTVALSRTASVGFSIVLNKPMASSQDFADWVPDDVLDSFYLLYSLRSMDVVFKQLQMGSTHKTIYMPDIMKLAIAFPPLEEQHAIVNYLNAKTAEIDSLIEAKQQMADKLREYRKSLISEAVTGKFKVPNLEQQSEGA